MVHIIGRYGIAGSGDSTYAILPRDYAFDGSKRGILFAWGHGDTESTMENPVAPSAQAIIYGLANAGYPVVVSDLGSPGGSTSQWGNANARTRLTSAAAFLQGPIAAKSGKVALAGFSMGGLTMLNWANANPTLTHSIAGFCPISNLATLRANATFTSSIDTAYGGAYSDASYGSTANPTVYGAALAGIPTKLYYSSTDPYATPATVTNLATVIGSSCTTVNTGANGHSWTVPTQSLTDYVAFLQANGA